ncbi:hypothetical protein [Synechococcus elongatus]|uniref:Uncharacterized protein n=1 Tax=Synechococcus elongatus PCC 11801 TaxID=2219813 RepID=A0AAN1QPC1_SYNEL|nr:hypothetical protein [Synechococcus elongatus]AZB72863.1 hypothetical protein DOP62_09155 [Synechococcus elongatus PCC 11801]
MKLTVSLEGEPAAIESVLVMVLRHLRSGQEIQFSTAIHPESGQGLEGLVEMQAPEEELAFWREALKLLDQAERLRLQGTEFADWLRDRLKPMDIPLERKVSTYAQLCTLEREQSPLSPLS